MEGVIGYLKSEIHSVNWIDSGWLKVKWVTSFFELILRYLQTNYREYYMVDCWNKINRYVQFSHETLIKVKANFLDRAIIKSKFGFYK